MGVSSLWSVDEVRNIEINGIELETYFYRPSNIGTTPTLLFLHEGLGSAATWQDFPGQVVSETGLPAIVYSRQGYGMSDRHIEPYECNFMHREALEVLPALLAKLEIERPMLLGHSDGASIALIHAAKYPVAGVVVEAPHIYVEEKTITAISGLRGKIRGAELIKKLACFHEDPEHTFQNWNNIWLNPDFRSWNIIEYVCQLKCPILAIQGEMDEYGTMAQIDEIAQNAPGHVTRVKLAECGHSPHRDQREEVVRQISNFINANSK